MSKGRILAAILIAATIGLVVEGTLNPVPTAVAFAAGQSLVQSAPTPEAAVKNLAEKIRLRQWNRAYNSLANKSQFTEAQFMHGLTGYYQSLRTYATLASYQIFPLHSTANNAKVMLKLHWSTVVGVSVSSRDLHVVKVGNQWKVNWPLAKIPSVLPQVVTEDYLRWDVIFRGPGDNWGAQNVDSPRVTIVDMHPVQRAEGVVVLGELLNQDVVPAYVTVKATLLSKNHKPIATEGCFDMISHILLPKQITPFLIVFRNKSLSDVRSIRMSPFSALVSAAAGPTIAINNQKLVPAPNAALNGQLVNESGKVISVAHVLGTLYNKNGQVVWVVGKYVDRALRPKTPMSFHIDIPEDLARKVASERTVVSSFTYGGTT